ncbi:delta-lactam-biosynthetic de-N-acetylase [Paenibacillus sp. JCM 10914]|uniref:delta-lactam-biosynthetic de-N-acetylase n=1 Tax=Paenibacillus sp. JCM 10914 TaxID=1236974 RepID=UPI0003CC42A3|nr:delta-lactam-biosynthetic de-N-acetylase [Paenibacillus sp. JCM 10914]GAE06692.1 carbohydrate Esterase Family 4 [Paenibacillus sp. JCM 10914]
MKPYNVLRPALMLLMSLTVILTASTEAWAAGSGPFHFGFKKSVNGQLPSINEEGFKELLQKYDAVFMGDANKKELYLTFDNGYENGFTPRILDTLQEKKVPAAFFVTGHYVKTQEDLLKRMTAEGHIIGNHSWNHPDVTTISSEKLTEELERVKKEVIRITGQPELKYLRTPRGIFDERSLSVSKDLGYTNVFWSLAYMDWDVKSQKGAQYAYDKVTAQLHPGAVILLHSISKDNTEALGRIIDEARGRGYEFKSLDQMQIKAP